MPDFTQIDLGGAWSLAALAGVSERALDTVSSKSFSWLGETFSVVLNARSFFASASSRASFRATSWANKSTTSSFAPESRSERRSSRTVGSEAGETTEGIENLDHIRPTCSTQIAIILHRVDGAEKAPTAATVDLDPTRCLRGEGRVRGCPTRHTPHP